MSDQGLELYRKACGLSSPLVLECDGPSQSAVTSFRRSFESPSLLIGRDPRSDLVLENNAVSRRHVFLQAIAGRLLVIDLQSRTKVYWEGEETPRDRGWLDPGHFIQVGPYRIRRTAGNAGDIDHGGPRALMAPVDQQQPEADPLPRAALELPIRTSEAASLWPVEGEFAMVGSSDECQLVLTDESVSRQHAALVATRSGLWVVDLVTREGVYVNGERIRWAWLADGDTLRFGRLTFILRYDIPPVNVTRQDIPLNAGAVPAERPGTELAVSSERSQNARIAVVARPKDRSHMALRATTSPTALESGTLVPSDPQVWPSSMPYPMNPMAMWQQQMQLMESFHNDMILMVQMFAAMHRQQLESVRHEMDMVQRLTGQLQDLQTKLAEPARSADDGRTASRGRPSENHARVPDPDQKKRDKKRASREVTDAADRPEPASPARPTSAAGPRAPKARPTQEAEPAAPANTGIKDDSQVLTRLTHRISELQRERQGYWQRILSALHK
jgi:pSer/pThr/pTyr-binding forkhead associated (FHA) protein